ncbi:hypothetical protein [Epibacterium sp. Ofav1-8]|uniref:hypothetical protein n=1 Tax=Epibacterium sp. Ofav1-8 TaxID=2917735 RepID=UPI001EF5A33F|nr:hypothetical protein [Epibacterium sp. Ofav1-8]MCG7626042.1 hypothetical protein [Epibacterium sp. Ofav1-8]
MRVGKGAGARLPGAVQGAPVHLVELSRPIPGEKAERVTPVGYKTARRTLPRLLSSLDPDDPRLMVAQQIADAAERVDAVPGSNFAGSDSKGEISDGGATTRVKHAARLRDYEALANGWPLDRRKARAKRVPLVALAVRRRVAGRHSVKAFDAVRLACVECLSLDEILRRHGWPARMEYRNRVRDAVLKTLDRIAVEMGNTPAAEKTN